MQSVSAQNSDAARGKVNLLGLTEAGLREYMLSLGEKPFRARQIMKWMHHLGVSDFNAMTDLGKALANPV